MQDILKDSGVRIAIIDPFTKWVPSWKPPADANPENVAFYDFDEEEVFHMAEVFQVESLSVVEAFNQTLNPEVGAEHFAASATGPKPAAIGRCIWSLCRRPFPELGHWPPPGRWFAWPTAITAEWSSTSGTTCAANATMRCYAPFLERKFFAYKCPMRNGEVRESLPNDLLHYRMIPGEATLIW